MRVLLQRVSSASVVVDEREVGAIRNGLLLLVGITGTDDERDLIQMADKIANLRIFGDADGKMNRSALDLAGVGSDVGALVVSQFTLYGDVRKGRRPSFTDAARPEQAAPMVERFATQLGEMGLTIARGEFGAHMQVALVNDGPVTIWIDSAELRQPRRGQANE
jgi:D-tyrosyl-tRNA(Tyr) deacylase